MKFPPIEDYIVKYYIGKDKSEYRRMWVSAHNIFEARELFEMQIRCTLGKRTKIIIAEVRPENK